MSGEPAQIGGMVRPERPRTLWASEAAVSDIIGRLIEFWGFKRNMGRVWTVLYLSPEPLSAEDLRHALQLFQRRGEHDPLGAFSRWGWWYGRSGIQGERKGLLRRRGAALRRMISHGLQRAARKRAK